MKNEDCIRIFGKNPSYEEFLNWVLKNNPKTFKPWDPPLTSCEIKLISSPKLKDEPLLLWTPAEKLKDFFSSFDFEYIREILGYIKEAIEKKISASRIFFLFEKLNKHKKNESYNSYIFEEEEEVLINRADYNLKYKLLKEMVKNPNSANELNLQDWTAVSIHSPIVHLKSGIEIYPLEEKWKKYFGTFKETLIKLKKEDMIKNPQNWRVERTVNFKFEESVYIVRKDNEEDRLNDALFSSQEFTEIERKIEGRSSRSDTNFLLSILILVLILLFAFFFFWWRRKKFKEK